MLAVENMFCHTDDSTLPSSTLDSDTDSCSSKSFPSSIEHMDQSLDVFTHSWPLSKDETTNHLGHQFNSFASWNDLNKVRPDTSTAWTRLDSRTFGTRSDQKSERGCSRESGTPLTRPDREPPARGCSPDASALYNNSTKHYNPSVSGQHAYQEMSDYREWANSYLQYSAHNTTITDLSRDLANGRTLLHLVEELLGVSMDPVHVKPGLKVQKIENTQKCLAVLAAHGIPVQDLSAEDIVEANPKVILVLCKHLKQYFGSTPGSLRGPSDAVTMNRRTPSPRVKHTSKSPVMDIEDVALLDWVGQMTGQVVSDYNSLQDGHILCLLVNKLTDGAVPDVVLEYGLPSEKVSLALMFSEQELGVTCNLSPDDVMNLNDASKMSSFLKTLHRVFLQQVQEHDITMQEIRERARKPGELTAKEKEMTIELVRHPETSKHFTPSSFAERVTRRRSGKKGSSVSNNAHKMPARFSVMDKVESKRRENSRENVFSSYLQDSANKIPHDNRLSNHFTQDDSHLLENLPNTNSSNRNSLTSSLEHPFHSIDTFLKNGRNKPLPRRKQDVVYRDKDVMHGLLAKESIFDTENWTALYLMQHAPKSWQEERQNVQHQISDFKNELQRLKEEYFRLRNMKVLQTPDKADSLTTPYPFPPEELVSSGDIEPIDIINSDDNTDCSSVDKRATKCTVRAGESVKESGQSGSCVIAYMNVKKGTLPPYRTWSKYENTDGDRYGGYSYTKKKTPHTGNNAFVQSRYETGSVKISIDRHARQADYENEITLECDESLPVSSTKRDMQGDGFRGVRSPKIVGKHLYGVTALARLSSKKANAVSDTDS